MVIEGALTKSLVLEAADACGQGVNLRYRLGIHVFHTRIVYESVDFPNLRDRYGTLVDSVVAHIALFEGMKYCSLFPAEFDVSLCADYLPPDAEELFREIYRKVFAQHKWEHNNPRYDGPALRANWSQDSEPGNISATSGLLLSCGGGKDSLASMRLLETAGIPYDVSQYSHSIYGPAAPQHDLINALVARCGPGKAHRMDVEDDFLSGEILKHPDFAGIVKTLCAPETPCSVFEALPLALMHNYENFAVGHERDADTGSFHWSDIDDDVNHQWGKSYQAEELLTQYVQTNLVKNFSYFSLLKQIYDFLIFQFLRAYPEDIPFTHSCNIEKPWCRRCAKCVYVWLGFTAYLDGPMPFAENLFDVAEVQDILAELTGLAGHRPFECVGEVDHARLACYFAWRKGRSGAFLQYFAEKAIPSMNSADLLRKYGHVHPDGHAVPEPLSALITPVLLAAGHSVVLPD
ncbi:MAG: hypothetical protein HOQ05_07070 [Corynebacteriales bacterium]|nr:hypothetical protein [Mycobacteriales bacterium]